MEIERKPPVANQPNQYPPSTPFPGGSNKQPSSENNEELLQRINPLTEAEVMKSVEALNRMSELTQTRVKFTYHEKSGEYFIKVIDETEDKVIREIPSKKILDIIASIHETMGLIFDKKI
jgi:flagellar protein FlaG